MKIKSPPYLIAAVVTFCLPSFAAAENEMKPPIATEELRAFVDTFVTIKNEYVDLVEDKKLFAACMSGMLSGVDSQSAYISSEEFNELRNPAETRALGGLGLEVAMEGGIVKVISPIEGGPAYKAGILSGDLIYMIDEVPQKNMLLRDVVKNLRGLPNSLVSVTILRAGEKAPRTFSIKREVIKVQSVRAALIEPGYAYIRVTQFQEDTAVKLVGLLKALFQREAISGLVLDLRDNPGGLFVSGIGVASIFLPPNALVVATNGRTSDAKHEYLNVPENHSRSGKDILATLPDGIKSVKMVVLVNSGSAAASELVAGALQDHERAVILGVKTFGRGSIQTIFPLKNGDGMKLTTARWFTPKGRSIHAHGIVPDVPLTEKRSDTPKAGTKDDGYLSHAISLLKASNTPDRR